MAPALFAAPAPVATGGGQVRVQSQVGEGTTMCIYLPRYRGAAQQNHAATLSTTNQLLKKILFIISGYNKLVGNR